MTVEDAVEELLQGATIPCGPCKGSGIAGMSATGPDPCGDCHGAGHFVRDRWLKARELLGSSTPVPYGRPWSEYQQEEFEYQREEFERWERTDRTCGL
jgi:hypothetical protein